MLRWDEDKIEVDPEDVAYRNEVKDAVFLIMDPMEQEITNITTRTREQLWQVYVSLQRKVDQILGSIKELRLPPVKTDILKNTDTGPAVGSSNREVRYRNVDSDCLHRIHRACDDCGQNEAERSNVCIGDALVDGGTLRWKFHEALDGLTQAEIASLSLDDIKKRKGLAMEQNSWMVAENAADRINHEPGPAGDYIQSFYFVTPRKNEHFFL